MDDELELITRNTVEILPGIGELKARLVEAKKEGRPLKIKYGVDPTAADIHLGHTVALRKLREFQDLGHEVLFIIGDFTARIGDPSGRNIQRKSMSEDEITANARTYQKQVFKILDVSKTKIINNSQWFKKMNMEDVLSLTSHYTVARVLERAEFKERVRKKQEISLLEFIYPLLQGYDSVMLENDIEIGGTDQTFNLLVGRDLQKDYGKKEQLVITMPLLEGTDGTQKMSKSYGNYIGIADPPGQIYGKCMSITDALIFPYLRLLTAVPDARISEIEKDVKNESMNPRDAKAFLASELVALYYDREEADRAAEEFENVFRKKELPSDIPLVQIGTEKSKIWIIDLLVRGGLVNSKAEANRLISQKAVKIDGEIVNTHDMDIPLGSQCIVSVGKRKVKKIVLVREEKE